MATVTLVTRGRKKRPTPKHHRFTLALPYLVPALILYCWFLLYPMLDAVRLSFFEWSGFRTEEPEWVGLDNYVRLFTQDPVFWTALRNSVIWVVLSIVVPTGLALLLALGLNRKIIGRNLMRAVFYIPAVFASITVAAMWRWIYNPTLGAVNQFFEAIGLGSWAQSWLGDPEFALMSIFVASIWQGVGFSMVLFLAGLQTVPVELTEAATLDGANAWQRFRAVTIPALRPTTIVVIILTIINALKVFDLVVGMTGGGPAQSTQVLALWSYTQSFTNHQFGMGGATATVLLIVTLALVIPYMAWSMKGEAMSSTTVASVVVPEFHNEEQPRRPRRDYVSIGLWVSLVISSVVWFLPLYLMFMTSVKSKPELNTSPMWTIPGVWEWGNYAAATETGDFWVTAGNSLLVAVIKVPIGLAIAAAAAFALARIRFKAGRVVLMVIAIGSMVPVQIGLGPLFSTMLNIGLLDSLYGLILPYLAFGIPYQIFVLYGFFRGIPDELEESARIDGASTFRIFWQIILPLAKPALAALFVLDFVATWNEYAMATTLLRSQDHWTIPLAVQSFSTQHGTDYGPMNAFIFMSAIPVLIVYLLFQRYFVQGALAGAVKG